MREKKKKEREQATEIRVKDNDKLNRHVVFALDSSDGKEKDQMGLMAGLPLSLLLLHHATYLTI